MTLQPARQFTLVWTLRNLIIRLIPLLISGKRYGYDRTAGREVFFDGMSVDKDELLFWLILDEFRKKFTGITDIVAVASMIASVPFVPVSGKLDARRATSRTSPLSLASRMLIRQRFKIPIAQLPGRKCGVVSGLTQPVWVRI